MKTTINSLKKTMITMTAIFALSFSTASFATETPKDSNAAGLHFVGKVENLPLFRLVLNNTTDEYVVTVREANGDKIFSERLKSKAGSISRMYKLNTESVEMISGTTFEVTNKSTNKTTVYKINNLSQTVENFTVAKL